jgi:ApaG protein
MVMYSEVTNSIKISVKPIFMDEQSEPEDFHFVWAYHVCIENQGDDTVQLMRRHWHITDSQGRIHEVQGEGVVGEKPILQPGESFEYTSGTPLATPSGFMVGSYQMVNKAGASFSVSVPAFSLDSPHDLTLVS